MTAGKGDDPVKQHFVPRFYLENFSPDGGNAISFYDINKGTHAYPVSVESQCYENYFYGTDCVIEKELAASVDGPASGVIKEIISSNKLPARASREMAILCMFTTFQRRRTAFARDDVADRIDKFYKHIAKTAAQLNSESALQEEYIDQFRVTLKNPSVQAMKFCGNMVPYFYTLQYRIYLNMTEYPFITSDNPVAVWNPYFKQIKQQGLLDWEFVGIQSIIPISPSIAIVYYDPDIYSFGNDKEQIININNQDDVDLINVLQILNAQRFLYYGNQSSSSYIDELIAKYKCERKIITSQVSTISMTRKGTNQISQFIRSNEGEIDYKYDLPGSSKPIPYERERGLVRMKDATKGYDDFMSLVMSGKYAPHGYIKYLQDQRATDEYQRKVVVTAGMSIDEFKDYLKSEYEREQQEQ